MQVFFKKNISPDCTSPFEVDIRTDATDDVGDVGGAATPNEAQSRGK